MRHRILLGVAVAAGLAMSWIWHSDEPRPADAASAAGGGTLAKPVPVVLARVVRRDVPVYLEGIGSVQAFNKVTVQSQVNGRIERILFEEGQEMKAGTPLARIDPRPFEANLRRLQAMHQRNRVQLDNARTELARYRDLANRQYASRQSFENQATVVAQFEAQLQADDAEIDSAKLDLEHTTISAPIGGRISMRLIDQGNMVRALDGPGIAIIAQTRPIAVVFSLPQAELGQVRDAMRERPPEVTVQIRGARPQVVRGELTVIENSIDPQSGTFRLKARFENEAEHLWPGQFVNVAVRAGTIPGALIIPAAAVQRGPQGTYVYVAKPNATVELRHVRIAPAPDETAVVESGLDEGDDVVVEGQHRLQPGSRIEVAAAAPSRP